MRIIEVYSEKELADSCSIMAKRTPTILLSGNEPLTSGGKPTQYTVLDYWRFQFSNIYHVQEEIAEFIVSMALGIEAPMNKNLWTTWDIDYRGKRIEVKETGYFHSFNEDGKVSQQRTFGIPKAYTKYKNNKSTYERQNDVYIFCLNTGNTKEESNPLELDHWRFWVVATATINHLCENNKTISLGRIKTITGQKNGIGYADLKAAVDEAVDNCS